MRSPQSTSRRIAQRGDVYNGLPWSRTQSGMSEPAKDVLGCHAPKRLARGIIDRFSIAWMTSLVQCEGTRRTPLYPPFARGEKDESRRLSPLAKGCKPRRSARHWKTALDVARPGPRNPRMSSLEHQEPYRRTDIYSLHTRFSGGSSGKRNLAASSLAWARRAEWAARVLPPRKSRGFFRSRRTTPRSRPTHTTLGKKF